MMKQILSFFLAVTMLLAYIPHSSAADKTETIRVDDGTGKKVTLSMTEEEYDVFLHTPRTKTGNQALVYKNRNGEVEWRAIFTASFLYDSEDCQGIDASCPVSVVDANWSQQSKNVRISGSTAIVDLVMYHKGQDKSVSYTLTLSCDKDGNIA